MQKRNFLRILEKVIINSLKRIFKVTAFIFLGFSILFLIFIGYQQWKNPVPPGLEEVANGDAIFWLMQKPTNRFMPNVVNYHFDSPLVETEVLARLKNLVRSSQIFRRNVVEVNRLPYWQTVKPDWNQNFQMLDTLANIDKVRIKADFDISQPSPIGEGLPLFRVYLSADRHQLLFIWHHVLSDFEGMFNKHAKHLFKEKGERTRFGYQIREQPKEGGTQEENLKGPFSYLFESRRPMGFKASNFEVKKIVLPIEDKQLFVLGEKADLPMSDIFSLIAMRAVTHYHESNNDRSKESIRPIVSPLSLRKNSLATDDGNNRAIKTFPLVFPLESIEKMHQRVIQLRPSSGSYDGAGKLMKIIRQLPFGESRLTELGSTDYISNYFPMADSSLHIADANLVSHDLRVPMTPYELTKFAWSNYNGEVQLYLHTDPILVDMELMIKSFEMASAEVLQYLSDNVPL